ncbi:MAG TPA: tetratricopeptide repeat protein [Tepidisphaeraceae bacterium]|nr:tetratricopeptide repeat protein [Tepidisphaeraceae bacterium]
MARRVNKKFLTILSLVIMGGLLAAVALPKMLRKADTGILWERADKQLALAREQKSAEQYKIAKEYYVKAYRADPNNVEGMLKYGDMLHELARYDLEEVGKDVQAWERTLEINPKYVPALERLVDAYMELCRLQPVPEAFKRLSDRAAALHRAQEDNVKAEAYEHIGIVGAWLSGAPTRESEIELSVAKLIDLAKLKSDEVEIPWHVAKADLRLAYNRASSNDPDAAKALREQAVKVFEDAIKAQPQSAALAYRYFQIKLSLIDPKLEGPAEQKELDRLQGLLDNARTLAKPDAQDYVDINLASAVLLAQRGKPAEGEKLVEELLKQRPDDQRVRFAMTSYWRGTPEKRQQAIELLSRPVGDDSNRTGFRALTVRELEFRRQTELAELRLITYDDTPVKDRPALREAIEQSYRNAIGIFSEEDRPALLKLKGKMLLLDNDRKSTVEAIRAMRAAYDKFDQRHYVDVELTQQLARLYYLVGETGQYKALLQRLIEVRPAAHQARKALVTLLLRERFFDEAKKHIEYLEQNLKDDPDSVRLRVAYLLGIGDLKSVTAMINSMSEATPQQKMVKAAALQVSGDNDRAEKLLLPLVKDEGTKNFEETGACQMLGRLYVKTARKEDAARLADDVLAKKPKDPFFRVLSLAARDKANPEELNKFREELNLDIADPVARQLENYWMQRQQNKPAADLEKMLVQLDQKNPNDGKILETLFNHGIDFGNLKLVADATEKLAKLNWDQADGLYFRTRLLMARRDGEAALQTAMQMSRRLPEFSRTWVVLGQAQQLNGQYESAVSSFNKALEMQLDNFDALRGLVECQVELRQFNEAKKLLARGAKTQNPAYFVEVAKRLQEFTGDPKSVTASREEDLKQRPEVLPVWLALIDNYVRVADMSAKSDPKASQDYLARAEARLKEALVKWPDDTSIYGRLADVEARANKPAEGLKVLETLAARDKWKDKPEPQLMLASYYMSLPPSLAADATYAANVAHAETALQAALAKVPGNIAISQRIIDFYLQTNQAEKAVSLLIEMIRTSNEPSLRQRLIELQVAMGRHKEAESMLQSALQARPDDVWLISLMGFVRMSGKDYRSAGEYFDRALKIKPDYALALYWRGVMKNTTGDVNGALVDFEQARNLVPSNVDFHVALADLYTSRNQFDEVVQELEAAVNLAPSRNDLRARLLQVHLDRKQWTSAEKILKEVKENADLNKIPLWWKLESQMWQMRGDPLKALDSIEQALKLNPQDQDAIQNLLKILIDSRNPEGYRRVIILTDEFLQKQQARPWWIYNSRGTARAALKQPAEAAAEFDKALSAVDASATPPIPIDPKTGQPVRPPTDAEIARFEVAADMYADGLVVSMLQNIGPKVTEEKLKDRRAARWEIEQTQVYMAERDWQKLVTLLDTMLSEPRFSQFRDHQQMRILRVSGQAYPAASATIPGTYEKGIARCQEYIERLKKVNAPPFTQVEALNNLASLIAENPKGPNPQEASQYSKRAYVIMKESNNFYPHIADTHGWILVLNGQVEEGIEVLRTATAAGQGNRIPAEAFYHLGEAYLKKSLNEEALTNLERALQIFDESTKKGVFVDPDLKTKADAAITRAKNKGAAAVAP